MKTLALLLITTTCGAPTVRVCVKSESCGLYELSCGVEFRLEVCEHPVTKEISKRPVL